MNYFLHYDAAKIVRLVVLTFLVTLLSYSDNSIAQSSEVEELKLKIEELKKRVQELESLNCAIVSNVKTKKVTSNPWHSLKVNMSKTEVSSLLGKPGKIDKWKTGEAWYFPNSRGGEVDFDANEKVTGWLEP